jgi:hypothetical protein
VIIARWRWPPDSWCGNACARRSGSARRPQAFDRGVPGFAPGQSFLELQHLGDLVTDRVERIQSRHRLLEDHRDFTPARGQQFAFGHREQVARLAFGGEHCRPCHSCVLDKPQKAERTDRLARAGLAH